MPKARHTRPAPVGPCLLVLVVLAAPACSPEPPSPARDEARPASLTRSPATPSSTPGLRARPTEPLGPPEAIEPAADTPLRAGRRPRGRPTLHVEADAVPDIGRAPLHVRFEAHVEAGDADFSCEWDFGDGARGTGRMVEHTYTAPGSYVARVLVTAAEGATASYEVGIQVDPAFDPWDGQEADDGG